METNKQKLEDNFSSSDDGMELEEEIRYDQQLPSNPKKPSKKKNIEEEEEWSEDNDEMEAEFEFYDPAPCQFHSVKTLVNGFIDGEGYFSSQLADLICQQPEVGTTIGVDNCEQGQNNEVIALSTIINLRVYKDNEAIKQIVKYVTNKVQKNCPEKEQAFNNLIASKEIGLFINERIINLAPKLVPILHNQLLEDLNWVKDQKDITSWNEYNFDYIIVISKCVKEKQKKMKKKVKQSTMTAEEYIYYRFEDYFLQQEALFSFNFPAQTAISTSGLSSQQKEQQSDQIVYRSISVIEFQKFKQILSGLEQHLVK